MSFEENTPDTGEDEQREANLCCGLCDHFDFCEGGFGVREIYGSQSCTFFDICPGQEEPLTAANGGPTACPDNAIRFDDADNNDEVEQGIFAQSCCFTPCGCDGPSVTATGTTIMLPVLLPVQVTTGEGYLVGAELPVVGGTSTETAVIVVSNIKTIAGQTVANFSGAEGNGTFSGGTGYAVFNTITMDDGSVITVSAVDTGVVTGFTISSNSTGAIGSNNTTLTQIATSGLGTGFTITLGQRNQQINSISYKQTAEVVLGEYTVLPADPVSVTGGGIFDVAATFNVDWGVKQVVITDGGSGYCSPPEPSFTDAGPGVEASATTALTDGVVTSVTVTSPGDGYVAQAIVTFPPPADGFTIQLWIYPDLSAFTSSKVTIMQAGSLPDDLEWAIEISDTGFVDFSVTEDGSFLQSVTSLDFADENMWSQVICTLDTVNETIDCQVNKNQNTGPVFGTPNPLPFTDTPFCPDLIDRGKIVIGKCDGTTYPSSPGYIGRLDEFAIWNRVLTEDEKLTLYQNGEGLCYDDWGTFCNGCEAECIKCGNKCFVCNQCWLDLFSDCCDCCDCCASATRSILCNEICAFYALNENADTIAIDASPNLLDLTKNGSPGPGSVSDGKVCEARSFNGTDQYFTHVHNDCFSIQQGYTIWGWFRTTNTNQNAILAAKGPNESDAEWEINITFTPGPSRTVTFKTGLNSVSILHDPPLPLGEWIFVSARFDPSGGGGSGAIFLRVQGETEGAVTNDPIPSVDTDNDFSLGAYDNGDSPFDGDLDEWGIVKRDLSFDEVESLVGPNQCCPITCCTLEEDAVVDCVFCSTGSEPATWGATFSGFALCGGQPFPLTTFACMTQTGDDLDGCPQWRATVGPAFQQVTYRIQPNGSGGFELDIWNNDLGNAPREAWFHGELTTVNCNGDTFTNDYTAGRCGTAATEFSTFWTVAATGGTVTISPGCTPFMAFNAPSTNKIFYAKKPGVIGVNKNALIKKLLKRKRLR